jgi:hypothetical protein
LEGLLKEDWSYRDVSEQKDIDEIETEAGTHAKRPIPQGLMWRRIFRDRDIYGKLFSICSLKTLDQPGQLNKREKTIAQGRLLQLVQDLIRFPDLATSQIPSIEKEYGVSDGGLLEFVATGMVDYQDDVLMHMALMDFFSHIIQVDSAEMHATDSLRKIDYGNHSSPMLEFMIAKGLHGRTMSYYLEPDKHDALDMTYLYGRSANYIAAYASAAPTHLFSSNTLNRVLYRLFHVLDGLPASQLASESAPHHDLHLLASLPRMTLLPRPQSQQESPLFSITLQPANSDVYRTLATIFGGPDALQEDRQIADLPQPSSSHERLDLVKRDRAAARGLYFLYLERNPNFWQQITRVASTFALEEKALAANALIKAVIESNWAPLPPGPDSEVSSSAAPFPLLTEPELESYCRSRASPLPPDGIRAIMSEPALSVVFPYLMKPAQSFSNVTGPRADVESVAYKVASAKHDVLISLHRRLKELSQESDSEPGAWSQLVGAVGARVSRGPLGGGSTVGGSVGVLEL